MNQVEASFLKKHHAYGNNTMTKILISEFVKGHNGNFSHDDETFINEIKGKLSNHFLDISQQSAKDLFISMTFRGMSLTWKPLPPDIRIFYDEWTIGPDRYGTDFGQCWCLTPNKSLQQIEEFENMTIEEIYFGLKADALNGVGNGLHMVLDAEQFNYAYHESSAAGFIIALHHHLDKPMIQFSSQLIFTGTETLINLKPTISYTTDDAISKFHSKDRGCYANGEANLNYLIKEYGYRYEMNNCLIDESIRDIIWNCRCIPNFMPNYDTFIQYNIFIPICFGEKLHCAKT